MCSAPHAPSFRRVECEHCHGGGKPRAASLFKLTLGSVFGPKRAFQDILPFPNHVAGLRALYCLEVLHKIVNSMAPRLSLGFIRPGVCLRQICLLHPPMVFFSPTKNLHINLIKSPVTTKINFLEITPVSKNYIKNKSFKII